MIPVLVVDNVNKLPGSLLAELQGYAKEAADDNVVKVIFVSSEGNIPHMMQGMYFDLVFILCINSYPNKCYRVEQLVSLNATNS
jgi:hypothetical protein